jgi:hypothetical protein
MQMSDLEMVKLCAAAMGIDYATKRVMQRAIVSGSVVEHTEGYSETFVDVSDYDPLHDDAQAMALVKRFELTVEPGTWKCKWGVYSTEYDPGFGDSDDLNRAIVECVAKTQAAK